MGDVFQNFKDWLKEPFRTDMTAAHWFYFLGLLIVIVLLWRIILAHIMEGLD